MSIKNTRSTLDIHADACCRIHGCRYHADQTCPVVNGSQPQMHKCGEAAACTEFSHKPEPHRV